MVFRWMTLAMAAFMCLHVCAEERDDPPIAEIDHDELRELSGMIPASQSGHYWGLNDSGNAPALFRFDLNGQVRKRVALGAPNIDWEAMTRDDDGLIYIGDFGDNDHVRNEYVIYRLREPGFFTSKINNPEAIRFRYPEAEARNCEAMFFLNDSLYLISKEDDGEIRPQLFRLDNLDPKSIGEAVWIGRMKLRGRITDAAYSKTLQLLAVLTKDELYLIRGSSESEFISGNVIDIKHAYKKTEGVCFDVDRLIVSNEDGELWLYDVNELIHQYE